MLALLGWVFQQEADATLRLWVGCAVVFSLLGDVLLLRKFDRFELGLSAFSVAHLAYIAAALTTGLSNNRSFYAGSAGAIIAALAFGWPLWQSLEKSRLKWPVMGYIVVIVVMISSVARTAIPLALWGAFLFAVSDALIGQTRFVRKRDDLRWLIHLMYHTGQGLLVVSLLSH